LLQFLDKLPKILSPAGNPDALVSAVYAGADAVYLGLDKFNARMKADNFNEENLPYYVNFCHLYGVKVFVTLNTSIKNSEFDEAIKLGLFCYNNFVDGLIVTDVAILNYFAKNYPEFDVTLSTQQNVHNVAGAKVAKALGSNRVVLGRETPLVDVDKVKESVDVDVETFLHGALCVSMSGQCYFSSFIDCNSGNRGLCAQPCRQKYTCFIDKKETKNGYLLSARDLCLARNLAKISYAGVDMLKIEGRNRRPQYVAQTTATYKKILNNNFELTDEDLNNLKKIYNRGNYTNGYLNNNANIIYPQAQGHIGVKVGTLTKIKNEWAVKSAIYLHDGDAFKIFRNNIEVGNAYCTKSSQNGFATLSVNGNCQNGDEVNITTSVSQIAQLDNHKTLLQITAIFEGEVGQKAQLTLKYNDVIIKVESDEILSRAEKLPLTEENIRQQLYKTGNTHFNITDIVVDIEDIFMPISVLNALRRRAIETLEKAILTQYNKTLNRQINQSKPYGTSLITPSKCDANLCVYIEEVYDALDVDFDEDTIVVYKPSDYNLQNAKQFGELDNIKRKFLDLPNFATESDYAILKSMLKTNVFDGVVVNNFYGIQLAFDLNLKIILGLGMNIFNVNTLNVLASFCGDNYYSYFYSQELSLPEIAEFKNSDGFIFAEGEICLMTMAHCPLHVNLKSDCGKCAYNKQEIVYIDKTNRQFKLKRKRISKCYWELFNCIPLCGNDKLNNPAKYLLKPSNENIKTIYNQYRDKVAGRQTQVIKPQQYTTGHLSKKVK